MVLEYLTGVLVIVLGLASVAAADIGILGLIGATRIDRCSHCGHWALTGDTARIESCPLCRHGQLMYPLRALAHHEWHVHMHRTHD